MSKELEALEKFLKDYLTLCEKLCTNKQEKMLLDSNSPYNILKTHLEAIDNSNPSEALECLEEVIDNLDDYADFEIKQEANEYFDTIKQALLKAQEPKQYLKWEDLEFKEKAIYKIVMLNGNKYLLKSYKNFILDFEIVELEKNDGTILFHISQHNKQFFNDLHLEKVEE